MINNGIKNELVFANYLNGKKYCELNFLMRELFKELYPFIKEESRISAWRDESYNKADIIVEVKNKKKYLSLKIGDKNSFHLEPISEFIHFLIECGVKRETVMKYLEFHYADGSRNGSGCNRIGVAEYKESHQSDIDEMNRILKSKKMIEKCTDRFILRGRSKSDKQIDVLIYGMVNDFFYLTKYDIKKIINSNIEFETTGLHMGPLYIQPQSRNLNYNPKYEKCRYRVQIKWFNLFDYIIKYKYELSIKEKNNFF